ncbi:LacI family DNA-binding transcriptional regulator [Tropicimonas marinistellae]|uniref:LacI family DNA-binding transcriptional regulator n=1 Tax=Tropicimonas marinistellae TaxID=1739787 RepID=UPI000A7DA3A3|nr:LacI family DNA-binding transcriptional regulator [Tropicimonas marinistellae]
MSERSPSMGGKVTIRTVAEDAGVSVAAVSKVLRNAYGVSDQLRAKVEASIKKLGYRPSTAARGMRGRTYAIGVLLVNLSNPFLPIVVGGVQTALRLANYKMLVGISEAQAHLEQSLIESMIDMRIDGLVLVAPRLTGESLSRFADQVPMVVIGHHENSAERFDTVNSNDRLGARLAVEALIAAGHSDVHMVSLPHTNGEFEVFHKREAGYLDAMRSAGLENRSRICNLPEEADPEDILRHLLSAPVPPTAVFCWSDLHGVGLLNAAKVKGIDVPGRLAIAGYDNTPEAALPLIGLTSIDQCGGELGKLSAATLLSRIAGRTGAKHHIVDPVLVQRTSS